MTSEAVLTVIDQVRDLPADALAPLVAEGERDGWRFVRRLADEWAAGINRFDRPGEALFVARAGSSLVGVCGLNADPNAGDDTIGRVRRLYVLREYRGSGAGRRLVEAVIASAIGHFRTLRVRTTNPEAGRLYERLGFRPVAGVTDCTHVLQLPPILSADRSTNEPR
ncbi:MAG TPA: GNAT family N-acetyltransferase [Gemmataceae bacterium]|jgi:GNAT superfamily N-acetyltransferase